MSSFCALANVTNAVLNGAGYLDLTGVANALAPLPPEVTSIGINLGGIISPPVPAEGTVAEPTALNGGVAFDSVAADIAYRVPPFGPTVRVSDPGIPVSWLGSVIGLGQFLGDQMLVTPPATAQATLAAAAAPKALAAAEAPSVADTPGVADSAAPAAVAKAPAVSKVPAVAKAQAAVAKARAALAKANQDKGDLPPGEWLPPNTAFRCQYAVAFIGVLRGYRLPVDRDSARELRNAAASCPSS